MHTKFLVIGLWAAAACASAQMEMETPGATGSVRAFESSTSTSSVRYRSTASDPQVTATLKDSQLMNKAPARVGGGGGAKPGYTPPPPRQPAAETRVLETGVDAKDFLQIIGPTLGKNLTAKQVDGSHVAVTGTSESLGRVVEVSQQIRSALRRPVKRSQIRVALLSDQPVDETSGSAALSPADVPQALQAFHLAADDLAGSAMPPKMYKAVELTAPASGGGENRVQLTDRMTILYELRPTLAGDFEIALNLAEREKGTNPFDAGLGRIVLANHFRAEADKPVVLGVTTPNRTLMLVFLLRSE
jgi:hypothetical protein